ncbi:putative endoglucanase ii [Diaporthe ampelina]|uniref:lytic cellulose monooxygenase (C4-dehydrogenating) n=1 Tax=Diaporthe ampelina TaxID=1214573 RepID=A0A0G2FRD1_9PEZI|nr:putative endoglucanase ii [Diaporthe ampelina]
MYLPVALVSTLAAVATAHQNLHQFWVNDVSPGYEVGIRKAPSNNPVTDVTSNDITCNVNGNNVPSGVTTVAARPGDTIKVQWDSSTHPGPITHMLFGPVADASQATGVGSWVKVDELDYVGGQWANEIMMAQNMTHEFKLPAKLASGDYLLRSEMLALHGAQTQGGAQFYIGCMQLRVTGDSASCSPSINLPGAYKATDSNIYISNFYNGFDPTTYEAPGGAVATCS